MTTSTSTAWTRTYNFEDFANGPICLNCGEPADHGVELGEEVELRRRDDDHRG